MVRPAEASDAVPPRPHAPAGPGSAPDPSGVQRNAPARPAANPYAVLFLHFNNEKNHKMQESLCLTMTDEAGMCRRTG